MLSKQLNWLNVKIHTFNTGKGYARSKQQGFSWAMSLTFSWTMSSLKGQWPQTIPRQPLTPHLLRLHVWHYPRESLAKTHLYDTITCFFFFQNLTKRLMTPDDINSIWWEEWKLMEFHVWPYLSIIACKFHRNTWKYVDTVHHFSKLQSKGQWPKMVAQMTFNPISFEVASMSSPKDIYSNFKCKTNSRIVIASLVKVMRKHGIHYVMCKICPSWTIWSIIASKK